MLSTRPKEKPDENDFLWASEANRAALTLGGVGGRGKEGGGLMLIGLLVVGVLGQLVEDTDRVRKCAEFRAAETGAAPVEVLRASVEVGFLDRGLGTTMV